MPKSVKPAPPQQSSLAEMWGGKRKRIDAPEPVKPEENVIEEEKDDIHPMKGLNVPSYLKITLTVIS